ncbi:MAG: zf-HC2 domain-containing protein [Pyrinomonadaceae bacterium]
MTHQEIIDRDVVERYALDKLPPDERRAFQEHFFECDECFQQAQAESRFIAGVRQAAATGALPASDVRRAASFWGAGWLRPVMVFSVTAVVAFAAAFVWLYAGRVRPQRQEQARQTAQGEAQPTAETPKRNAEEDQTQPGAEQAAEATPEPRREQTTGNKPKQRRDQNLIARAVIPSVTLESTRAATEAAELTIAAGVEKVSLRIPVEAGNRFENFAIDILTKGRVPVTTVGGLRPRRDGALAVRVPAARFESGAYRVKLYGQTATERELLAEYDLRVIKK